jgi:hypothetical protein
VMEETPEGNDFPANSVPLRWPVKVPNR